MASEVAAAPLFHPHINTPGATPRRFFPARNPSQPFASRPNADSRKPGVGSPSAAPLPPRAALSLQPLKKNIPRQSERAFLLPQISGRSNRPAPRHHVFCFQ